VLKADPAAAGPPLQAAIAVARRHGQRELLSEALSMASVAANMAGDRAAARELLLQADAIAADLGQAYPPGMVAVLQARRSTPSSPPTSARSGRRPAKGPGWPGSSAICTCSGSCC
jgi:hypothetical protein